ncbi:MAG: NAD-dependent epimerase/dehydratase family protein [Planctomycetaceae bacterium]|nr:NAD-dependent epimerase/dehydratase family protein [Planctomycetaceae bacterium]
MSILVTGGAGFIGSHLVETLVHITAGGGLGGIAGRIIALDNFNDYYDPRLKRANAAALAAHAQVAVVEGDFRDCALVRDLLAKHRVRAICHLGAAPGVPFSLQKPLETVENNVLGTLALLEAARQHPVERFVFASSSSVYGRGAAAPFVEDAPLGTPANTYGASKRAAELLGLTYAQSHGVPFVSLRFFNVYGPRLRPEMALAVFTRKILEGSPLPLHGDGSVLRDFTHVSDICRGIVAALTAAGVVGQCLNLGNDRPITIRRLIELIEQAAGRMAVIDQLPPRSEDLPLTHASLEKSRRLLGYAPTIPVEQGVAEYVEWMRGTSK